MGGIVVVMSVITFVLYRNWKYEQELDSLLWKVDFRDIQMSDDSNANSIGTKISRVSQNEQQTQSIQFKYNINEIETFRNRTYAFVLLIKESFKAVLKFPFLIFKNIGKQLLGRGYVYHIFSFGSLIVPYYLIFTYWLSLLLTYLELSFTF